MNWFKKTLLDLFTGTPRAIATSEELARFMDSPCLIAIQQRAATITNDAIAVRVNPDAPQNRSDMALGGILALEWLLDERQLEILLARTSEAGMKKWQQNQAQIRALRKALTDGR